MFDSSDTFLYRQKGQLKLDNTIVEEFLPWLVKQVFVDQFPDNGLILGPATTLSHIQFDSDLANVTAGGGINIRTKDQDFTIARPLFLRASHRQECERPVEIETHLAYVAAEIKTNLDKTMFQEAAATARDLKAILPNSQYFLLCEWLDMRPVNTSVTSIEEVIILRKARRISAKLRQNFDSADRRKVNRDQFKSFLSEHPFAPDVFAHFLSCIEPLFEDTSQNEGGVLERGWF